MAIIFYMLNDKLFWFIILIHPENANCKKMETTLNLKSGLKLINTTKVHYISYS